MTDQTTQERRRARIAEMQEDITEQRKDEQASAETDVTYLLLQFVTNVPAALLEEIGKRMKHILAQGEARSLTPAERLMMLLNGSNVVQETTGPLAMLGAGKTNLEPQPSTPEEQTPVRGQTPEDEILLKLFRSVTDEDLRTWLAKMGDDLMNDPASRNKRRGIEEIVDGNLSVNSNGQPTELDDAKATITRLERELADAKRSQRSDSARKADTDDKGDTTKITRERDEARGERDRARADLATAETTRDRYKTERDSARAEVTRLQGARPTDDTESIEVLREFVSYALTEVGGTTPRTLQSMPADELRKDAANDGALRGAIKVALIAHNQKVGRDARRAYADKLLESSNFVALITNMGLITGAKFDDETKLVANVKQCHNGLQDDLRHPENEPIKARTPAPATPAAPAAPRT